MSETEISRVTFSFLLQFCSRNSDSKPSISHRSLISKSRRDPKNKILDRSFTCGIFNLRQQTVDMSHVSLRNAYAPDLLAVGYGNLDFHGRQDGMVAFWSLKNPEHPEWSFPTSFGVTALDFSCTDFNLLAVGLFDGTVSVYDVCTPTCKALAESGHGVRGNTVILCGN